MASILTTLGALPPFLIASQAILIIREFDLNAAMIGALISTHFGSSALSAIIIKRPINNWSKPFGYGATGLLLAIGSIAIVFITGSVIPLYAAMTVYGIANAFCHNISNRTISTVLPPTSRGLGFGIKQGAVPLAIMLGGLAAPTVTGLLGWRGTFAITGVIGLLLMAGALITSFRGGKPERDVRSLAHRNPRLGARAAQRAPRGPLLMCAIAIFLASLAANFLGAYVASWAFEVGLTLAQGGLLMAAGSLGSVLMRIYAGFQADRRHGGNLSVATMMMWVGAACLALLGLVAEPWSVIVFGFLAFTVGWAFPGLLLFAIARIGRDAPVEAASMVQAGAFAGGAVGPLVLGQIVVVHGFSVAWIVAASAFLVSGMFLLVARHGFRQDLVHRPPSSSFGYGGGRDAPRYIAGPAPDEAS